MQSCVVSSLSPRNEQVDNVAIAFPFPELAEDALIVDVGGGIGSTTLRLAERFPKLRFIIQDREPVCKLGEDVPTPSLINSSCGVDYSVGMAYSQPHLNYIWPGTLSRSVSTTRQRLTTLTENVST